MKLRVAGIVKESVVDGPGFRYVVFAQGCPHRCKGCHNPSTHDAHGGININTDKIVTEIMSSKYIDGITFSGGEPFMQAEAFSRLARDLKARNVHIVCYSGYTYEELVSKKDINYNMLLGSIDILIDGPYIEELRDLSLSYRGSRNQRIINVPESIRQGQAILENLYKAVS